VGGFEMTDGKLATTEFGGGAATRLTRSRLIPADRAGRAQLRRRSVRVLEVGNSAEEPNTAIVRQTRTAAQISSQAVVASLALFADVGPYPKLMWSYPYIIRRC
jgi:hypothetical protein